MDCVVHLSLVEIALICFALMTGLACLDFGADLTDLPLEKEERKSRIIPMVMYHVAPISSSSSLL